MSDETKELKKEIIRLKSLCRRSADEIRDLDSIIIKLHDQFPEVKKELNWNSDGFWAGEASINLLNRLDGKTNGGYVENYGDLHLELKTLDGYAQIEHPDFYQKQNDNYDYDCDDVRHHCGACGCEPCQCKQEEHSPDCKWHKDWHACDCGAFEVKKAADKVNGFICDACGERKEGKLEAINTETLAGIVMCESCSAPKSCDSSCTDDSCPICGGNTPERIEEQIEWLKKVAEDKEK